MRSTPRAAQTTDPNVALDGGTVQPIGGPKGSALAMLMDVMGGVISGAAFGGDVRNHFEEYDQPQNVGHFIMAMKPDLFVQPRRILEAHGYAGATRARSTRPRKALTR